MISIYIIKKKSTNLYTDSNIYVGQTLNFKRRTIAHRYNCKNTKHKSHNLKVYKYIRGNGGIDQWEFIEIYKIKNKFKNLGNIMETRVFNAFNPKLNTRTVNITTRPIEKKWTHEQCLLWGIYDNPYYNDNYLSEVKLFIPIAERGF